MGNRVYSYDEMVAALCIMEEMVDPILKDASSPWVEFREAWGVYGLRDVIITDLAHACDAAWTRACIRRDDDPQGADPGAFDWDFVPVWIRECVDWSGDRPRVRGATT